MTERTWEIYALADPRTEEVRYVGVTFRQKRRFNEHLSRARTGGKGYRDCWIRSLLKQDLKPVRSTLQSGQGEGWQEAERAWIAHYRPLGRLVNLTDGGEGNPGYMPTPELRAKWSRIRKGKKYKPGQVAGFKGKQHTPEAIEKIKAASRCRRLSDVSRAKLSASAKGRDMSGPIRASAEMRRGKSISAEHRRKIKAACTTRKAVLCVETGEIVESVTEAARRLGVNEASVYQSIRKGCRCKGNHWRFASDKPSTTFKPSPGITLQMEFSFTTATCTPGIVGSLARRPRLTSSNACGATPTITT